MSHDIVSGSYQIPAWAAPILDEMDYLNDEDDFRDGIAYYYFDELEGGRDSVLESTLDSLEIPYDNTWDAGGDTLEGSCKTRFDESGKMTQRTDDQPEYPFITPLSEASINLNRILRKAILAEHETAYKIAIELGASLDYRPNDVREKTNAQLGLSAINPFIHSHCEHHIVKTSARDESRDSNDTPGL